MAYQHVLTDDEKTELLRIARATLREYLRTGRIPPGKPHRESLVQNAGVFVTLQRDGELRGCIGRTDESAPLYKTIQEMAAAAASRDPRFPAVSSDEFEGLQIEISVLGGHSAVTAPGDIAIGRDGLVIEREGQRGLLLPQVAAERAWDAATFLEQVCLKAGLPGDAWQRPDARIERFTAQVFSDSTHPPQG